MIYDDSILGTMADSEIAKLTNKSKSFVRRRRVSLKIPAFNRDYGYLQKYSRKYDYNENIFDKIDNVSAYWLGFYFADGCIIQEKTGSDAVVLMLQDEDPIRKLVNFYKFDGPINTRKGPSGKMRYTLKIRNQHLFNRLNELGCVPRKSLILGPPKINEKYFMPFLMGFYDGDGSVYKKISGGWTVSIGCASKAIFDWIVLQAQDMNLSYNLHKKNIKSGIFHSIRMSGLSAKTFLDKLYSSVPQEITMNRKRERYNRLKVSKFQSPRFFDWELEIIQSIEDDKICSNMINADSRNYGWKRSVNNIYHKRRKSVLNHNS